MLILIFSWRRHSQNLSTLSRRFGLLSFLRLDSLLLLLLDFVICVIPKVLDSTSQLGILRFSAGTTRQKISPHLDSFQEAASNVKIKSAGWMKKLELNQTEFSDRIKMLGKLGKKLYGGYRHVMAYKFVQMDIIRWRAGFGLVFMLSLGYMIEEWYYYSPQMQTMEEDTYRQYIKRRKEFLQPKGESAQ